MKSRTRSRKPASIGSNHSSRRPTAISASEPRTGNFVLLLVMAWSPPAHNAGIVWVSAPGDYATFNSNHTPDGTLASRARRFARLQQQLKIDLLEQAVVPPVVEIALHGCERGKVLRQHSPLTACPRDIQDRIEHAAQSCLARAAQTLNRRHVRRNQRPLGIRQIACVALTFSLILPASDFGPHLVPR